MKVNEIKPNTPFEELTVKIVEKSEPREFEKFGKKGRVCSCKGEDDTGAVTVSLWNEDVDKVAVGNSVTIKNGFAKEWQGDIQVSAGLKGSLEVSDA